MDPYTFLKLMQTVPPSPLMKKISSGAEVRRDLCLAYSAQTKVALPNGRMASIKSITRVTVSAASFRRSHR